MEIAKGITGKHFLQLDLSAFGPDWLEAISIFKKRISERFIEPADKLIELEEGISTGDKKYGFAILALDCLLCETIQSFYDGIENSSGKSTMLFVKFLRQRMHFKPHFVTDGQAEEFYRDFRCSLLHQAQTSGSTKIWAVGPLINRNNGDVIVNRLAFHQALKNEFDLYLDLLTKQTDQTILNNFKKKMVYIANGK